MSCWRFWNPEFSIAVAVDGQDRGGALEVLAARDARTDDDDLVAFLGHCGRSRQCRRKADCTADCESDCPGKRFAIHHVRIPYLCGCNNQTTVAWAGIYSLS